MNLKAFSRATETFLVDNSPAILTGLGVAGTIATAFLSAKGAYLSAQIIELEERRLAEQEDVDVYKMDAREAFPLVWQEFIPAAVVGTISVAAIISANRVGSRRAAAVVAAFQVTDRALTEYKEKVIHEFGEAKARKIDDAIAQDKIDRNVGDREIVVLGDQQLFLDAYTGRTFQSTYEDVKAAQNWVNYELINNMHCSLSDYYDRIGISKTSGSDQVGWNCDKQLELEITPGMTKDKKPCLVVTFATNPFPQFYRLH